MSLTSNVFKISPSKALTIFIAIYKQPSHARGLVYDHFSLRNPKVNIARPARRERRRIRITWAGFAAYALGLEYENGRGCCYKVNIICTVGYLLTPK